MIETGSIGSLSEKEVTERAAKLRLLLMDVDGVLTDGKLYYMPDAQGKAVEFKGFNTQDGLGIHFLGMVGIKTGVISGRDSFATTERARILNMSYVYQGHLEKVKIFEEILGKESLQPDQVGFIGDDFTDLPLMQMSGLGVAVANAREEVRARADYVTSRNGGDGAVREVAELILRASGKWSQILDKYGID